MSQTAVQPFSGSYRAQPEPSTFAFAVRHSGAFWFRGSFSDVAATLRDGENGPVLQGSAVVDSVSVAEPAAMRASLLGPEFFDAERYPEISFRSNAVRLNEETAEVDGELMIRGTTRPIAATGHYSPPRQTAFGVVAGLQLQTEFDRRDFGLDWQMELPEGGEAVGWDIAVNIDLLLIRQDEEE